MADETQNEEIDEQDGSPLPAREMMSLLSTSPASGPGEIGTVDPGPTPVPADQPPGTGTTPLPHVQPIGGDEMHTTDGDPVSADPRHETISQSDSASSQT